MSTLPTSNPIAIHPTGSSYDRENLIQLFRHFHAEGIEYCILHGWESLFHGLDSDIDMLVRPTDLYRLENSLHAGELSIVQLQRHETTALRFDTVLNRVADCQFLPLDVSTDFRFRCRMYLTAAQALEGRTLWRGIWIASPMIEYSYVLSKKVLKGWVPDHKKGKISAVRRQLGEKAVAIDTRLFGETWGGRVNDWLKKANWEEFERNMSGLQQTLKWHAFKRRPCDFFAHRFLELYRFRQRAIYPTGLFISVLGLDGAGKTSLISALTQQVSGPFRHYRCFHFRPNLLRIRKTSDIHHQLPSRSTYSCGLSILKLVYYFSDFWCGYLVKVWPALIRSGFVLFDRYFDDLLADPNRYRYGGSTILLRLTRKLVPKPNLSLLLDVAPQHLWQRKQEISQDKAVILRKRYLDLVQKLPNTVILDGTQTNFEVSQQATRVILGHLHQRYLDRRNLWFQSTFEESLEKLTDCLCSSPSEARFVSSKTSRPCQAWTISGSWFRFRPRKGASYYVPQRPGRVASAGLRCYNPQNRLGKVAKKHLGWALKLGVPQYFMRECNLVIDNRLDPVKLSKTVFLEYLKETFDRKDLQFSISLGTPGPHRKTVLQILTDSGSVLGYAKIGHQPQTVNLVQQETRILKHFDGETPRDFVVPRIIASGDWKGRYYCVLSALTGRETSSPPELATEFVDVLRELASRNRSLTALNGSSTWSILLSQVKSIENPYYRHLLESGIDLVNTIAGDQTFPFYLCHGDFAPWNSKLVDGRLLVFDWEYAELNAIPGYDLFHFLVQTQSLLKRKHAGEVWQFFQVGQEGRRIVTTHFHDLGIEEYYVRPLFLLYLLKRIAFLSSMSFGTHRQAVGLAKMAQLELLSGC